MPEKQTLMTGLVVGESPRWHEGRLWFSNWGAGEIIAVDTEGNGDVMARFPTGRLWTSTLKRRFHSQAPSTFPSISPHAGTCGGCR
jgi:sugar lactone lactonase YvrE